MLSIRCARRKIASIFFLSVMSVFADKIDCGRPSLVPQQIPPAENRQFVARPVAQLKFPQPIAALPQIQHRLDKQTLIPPRSKSVKTFPTASSSIQPNINSAPRFHETMPRRSSG